MPIGAGYDFAQALSSAWYGLSGMSVRWISMDFLHESWVCVVIISDPVLWNLFEPVGASQPMTLASLELFF